MLLTHLIFITIFRNMSKYSNDSIEKLAGAFKALSNPNRLKLYLQLSRCCTPGTECAVEEAQGFCVGELGNALDIALSTLSHHLKELHRAELIRMNRQGKQIYCSVNPEMVRQLADFFN